MKMAHRLCVLLCVTLAAQGPAAGTASAQESTRAPLPASEAETALALNNADLRDALRLIAEEYGFNIVLSDDVVGSVSLRLAGASLNNTLDALLIARGYDYEFRDNIIRVAPAAVIEAERNQRRAKQELEPLTTEAIVLKYLDGNDVKDTIESMLSSRGSVTVLERSTFRGFQFGAQTAQQVTGTSGTTAATTGGGLVRGRSGTEAPRSNLVIVTDVRSQIDRIKEMIERIDVAPRQVLIDAKILEVNIRSLEDLGIDFNQRSTYSVEGNKSNIVETDINSSSSTSTINSDILSNTFPVSTDAGIHTVFTKLNGEDFTVVLHALLQDSRTKTLSAPRILTIENQEAAILVGEQFPIFQSTTSDQGTVSESLSFFQPVGVSLQVICQVTPRDEITMIIHPTVSSVGAMVTGASGLQQPRINTREADTRVIMRNGETLVIGGLLEDEDGRRYFSLPWVDRIPILGRLFSRKQLNVDQRNLLIFMTPGLVEAGRSQMASGEQATFTGISDPGHYGYLYDRRKMAAHLFRLAKKSYKAKQFDEAKALFLKLLALDPEHKETASYLKKLAVTPAEKPLT